MTLVKALVVDVPSLTASCSRYVPGAVKTTVEVADVGALKVAVAFSGTVGWPADQRPGVSERSAGFEDEGFGRALHRGGSGAGTAGAVDVLVGAGVDHGGLIGAGGRGLRR